jgi:hypothetical protein
VQQAARTLWSQQPQAAEALIRRWLGGAERYAQV